MLLSLSAVFTTLLQSGGRPTPSETAGQVASVSHAYPLTSPTAGIRTIRLADGSKVTLDAGTSLTVAYDQRRRVLTLIRGRARFEVAHEARPFVVAAGAGDITAHGTIFDVEITDGGRVQVALIRGAIGVRVRDKSTNAWALRELTPHQKTDFDPTGFITRVQPLAAMAKDWPTGVVDVDAMPLAELLRDANRYTTAPIEVAQPDLASLHVSGRFQVDRPDLLVQNLADLFDLTVDRSQKGRILLRKNFQAGAKPA
jgi:transmembrane sensor